jgi:hypothetical protein
VAYAFWQAVGTNLREGLIRLVFVADEIPASLQRLVEFLNEQMPRVEVLAVEIRQYRADGSSSGALVSRLVGQTARAQAAKERSVSPSPVRRSARWTIDDVLKSVAQVGKDATAVAGVVCDWATAHPYIRIIGGIGLSYPSLTMSADSGRSTSRWRGVLSLYGSPHSGSPMLEVRVKQMCETSSYNRNETRGPLSRDLRGLSGRVERLLSVVDRWIEDVRAHTGDPETADETSEKTDG